ncbi:MAG: PAS domain S-box protein [Alphaproteobacteria bacterium]|nr:MAG: PAS domain S-box protein [Alphaproteobacteria bacterium]
MLTSGSALVLSLAYLSLLFAIAWKGDRNPARYRQEGRESLIYGLSLAVYCTSWTFYGSVGRAVTHGYDFLLIYIGPLAVLTLGLPLLRALVRRAKAHGVTSIADFLGARYGKSRPVAALVTLIATIGVLPYIALQLKAVSYSFDALAALPSRGPAPVLDTAFWVAALMAVFTILFGVRSVQATERNTGLVLAVAFESLVKLAAFMAVGLYVCFWLFDGPSDLIKQAATAVSSPLLGDQRLDPAAWVAIALVSAAAFVCLPRQFHVTVVECGRPEHLSTAVWMLPLYFAAITMFVPPIALAGKLLLGSGADPDLFVLTVPQQDGQTLLTLIAFLGGLSAATGMVIVACVALATMVSNELVIPFMLRRLTQAGAPELGPVVLQARRWAIIAILSLAYLYHRLISGHYPLAAIGLMSFAAVAQFAPPLVLGLMWKRAHRHGVVAGLLGGWGVWTYGLLLPSFADAGWIAMQDWVSVSDVMAWLGAPGLDRLSAGVFASLALNTGLLVGVSLLVQPTAIDRSQSEAFTGGAAPQPRGATSAAALAELRAMVARVLGQERTDAAFAIAQPPTPAAAADLAERLLASAIGSASARIVVAASLQRRGRMDAATLQEATRAILEGRDLLRVTLDSIGQGIAVFDDRHKLAAWNPRFVDLFGLRAALLQVGTPLHALVLEATPGDLGSLLIDRSDPERARSSHSYERRRPDGIVLAIETTPLPTGGFVVVATDVTARVRTEEALREAERQIRVYTDNVPVYIAYVDRTQRYRFINRPYLEALGLDPATASGVRLVDALGEERYAHLKERIDAVLRGIPQSFEVDLPVPGDDVRLGRGTYLPHRTEDGEIIGFFTLYQDITDQRRTEQALEARVEERTRALAQAKQAADEANLGKTRFIAAASHDLLQPLHAARLFTATLAEQAGRRERPLVDQIDQALGAVEDLLSALLDISKLDAGALKPERRALPLNALLEQLVQSFQPMARQRGLRLRMVPTRLAVESDPQLLRRILQNFLANALRYSRRGGVVVGARRRGQQVEIQVVDTGPGIPENKQRAIFEEFQRLGEDAPDQPKGLGLGLAIVERIGRMLNHPIRVRSRVGFGSIFSVSVPRGVAVLTAPPPPPVQRRIGNPLNGRRVLCIDDDATVIAGMRALLDAWGVELTAVTSVAAARAATVDRPPELLLIDYHIGDDDTGFEALNTLERQWGRLPPTILITADRSDPVRLEAQRRHVGLLHKPVKPAALRALMTRMVDPPAAAAD